VSNAEYEILKILQVPEMMKIFQSPKSVSEAECKTMKFITSQVLDLG
jgi:hypothetical protein